MMKWPPTTPGIAVLAFWLLYFLFASCCRRVPPETVPDWPAPAPQPGCLTRHPPSLPVVELLGPDAGCPEHFIGCVDIDNALMLELREHELTRYAREAWALCGTRDGG